MEAPDEAARSQYRPITARGKRWSPLGLAFLSLVFDVLFIPTFFAISRALSELREVDRREAAGYVADEHVAVRTGAVWAIFLASLRPIALGTVAIGVVLAVMVESPSRRAALPAQAEPAEASELEAIVARLGSPVPGVRRLAVDHLAIVGAASCTPEIAGPAQAALRARFDALAPLLRARVAPEADEGRTELLEVARLLSCAQPDDRSPLVAIAEATDPRLALVGVSVLLAAGESPSATALERTGGAVETRRQLARSLASSGHLDLLPRQYATVDALLESRAAEELGYIDELEEIELGDWVQPRSDVAYRLFRFRGLDEGSATEGAGAIGPYPAPPTSNDVLEREREVVGPVFGRPSREAQEQRVFDHWAANSAAYGGAP